ncbi:glypican-5-like [Amphibalanus amphitrite]|uniref:glypican-5-like n=1 Tax=Amphibalanus amphitrite TaxID=1232801 RepID=UPI001C8FB579|nr:glypican-5-like [Amphibalanus amphitrite]
MWPLVLTCALLAGGTARAAVVTAPADCPAVRSMLLEKGVAESALSSSGASSEVCQAGSCCSRDWEHGIRDVVHREFRRRLVDSTDQVKNLLHLQVSAVQDAILRLIHNANQSTIDSYSHETDEDSQNQTSDNVAKHALPTLFGQFMRYFQSELSDPELETAVTEFFDELFVVTYGRGAQLNATFASCLREKRLDIRPFRDVPFRMKEKLLRTFGLAKFYLQSLYGGLAVLNTTTHFQCTESCYQALTRLSYCQLCRGHSQVRPCNEFCFNVMRGCMAPLSTLNESWQTYVEVLRKLATSLQAGNNVETYLLKLYVNISEAMSLVFTYREEVDREVRHACGSSEPSRRRRRRDVDMQYRSSGDMGGLLPPLPRREQLIDFDAEGEPLNKLLRAFTSDVDQHKNMFQTMPEDTCNDVSTNNSTFCWNGDEVGEYVKPVAGMGLDSQEFNPEVVVPQIADSTLKEKANMLDQIQQGSNDKLATMPPVDSYGWGDPIYGDMGSGYGSGDGIYGFTDDEDGYHHSYYDYDDLGSGSGDYDDWYDYGDWTDYDHGVTIPTTVYPEEDGADIDIPSETDVVEPEVKAEPPPATTKPTTKAAPAPTTARPAGGSAAAVTAGWSLLVAALLATRL